jgi:ribosome-associated heat shock protein Hsp15
MNQGQLRADKWLWFARLVKSRSLGAALCSSGRLRVNGTAVSKAATPLRPGDVLVFPWGGAVRIIRVRALGTRRGPAPEAQRLYVDLARDESGQSAGGTSGDAPT